MGLLSLKDRHALLDLLLRLDMNEVSNRSSLLAGLPDTLAQTINRSSNAIGDLNAILDVVNGSVWSKLPNGSWSVVVVIENAIEMVRGSILEPEFEALRNKLLEQQFIAPGTVGQTIASRPNNLPSQPGPLIGRQEEILQVCNLLSQDQVRLVTLTGPGGTGKTRLGIEIASQMLNDFEQGVVFVALAPISDPSLVAAEIAQTYGPYGLKESGNLPLLESLKTFLRDKHMLLLIDNFEHVVEASLQVAELLDACKSLKVLVTSRRKLDIGLEHEFNVLPLTPPDARQLGQPGKELIGKLSNNESVMLFVDRARAELPKFKLSPENAQEIAEICIQLRGLPLAIELAAARISKVSLYEIKSQLKDRVNILQLSSSRRDRESRHRSLEAAIDWSYDLLSDAEQLLFRQISIFSGGWTRRAAAALNMPKDSVPAPTVRNIAKLENRLELLVANNLVLTSKREDGDGEPRYNMLETIREYALEHLADSNEEEEIRRRHAQFFLDFAEEAEPMLEAKDSNEWMERLEVEYDNMRMAMEWMIEHGEADWGLRMGGALWRFWYVRSYFGEGRDWLTKLLALPISAPSKQARAKALNGAGNLAYNQGDYTEAQKLHEECLGLWRELQNEEKIAGSLNNLGLIARYRGAYQQAIDYYQQALRINQQYGNQKWEAMNLDNWGNVSFEQGDYGQARERYKESLAIFTQLSNSWGMAMAECDLANVLQELGELAEAQEHYENSLAKQISVGDRKVTAAARLGLGYIACKQGHFATARARFEESLKLARDISDQQGIMNALEGFAALAAAQAKPHQAFRLAGAAAKIRHALGIAHSPSGRARLNSWLASAKQAVSAEAAAAARQAGWNYKPDEALAYALAADAAGQQ